MVAPNDKRPAAGRANAAKSTGPRTEAGKARSSMNAVKHGLTAQTSLLPGEDADELRAFAAELEAQLRPLGALQKILAQRVVAVAWKLRRVALAEERAAVEMDEDRLALWEHRKRMAVELPYSAGNLGPRPRPRDAAALLAESFPESRTGERPEQGRLAQITAHELKLESALRATVRELRALQKDGSFAPREPEESAAEAATRPATHSTPAPQPAAAPTPTGAPDAPTASNPVTAVDAVTAPAPAAHSGKPPRLAAVEPSPEAAFDPEGPSFPQKNTADQNELPPELETPDPAQNESAGP